MKTPKANTTPLALEIQELAKTISQIPEGSSFRQWLRDRTESFQLGDREARYLVDTYYIIQEGRKALANQRRALSEAEEPAAMIEWLSDQNERLEAFIKAALATYVARHKMGVWLEQVYGVGVVISAGLLAYIDITKAPTVGHIWQFCGIAGAGQHRWEPHTKRPWSASAKVLTFKAGDSFIKFSNRDECVYGAIYRQRKAYEIANNDAGRYAEQATREMPKKAKTTTAWPWNAACYPSGTCAKVMDLDQAQRDAFLKTVRAVPGSGVAMLHPGHINDRARRYAVKQFLADFHGAWFRAEFRREPPAPYPIAILGHARERRAVA